MAVWRRFVGMVLVVVVAGCSPVVREPAPAPEYTVTDVAWLQLTDALHTRALPLLELAPERASSRALADLAVRLGKAHEAGRGRLRALLAEAGITGENPHTLHDMPGMPTAQDLKDLAGLRKSAFDRRFAALLRAHLEQLVLVANGERDAGGAAGARRLAEDLAREHTGDLAELDRAVAA
uniref:Putative lipoprotein n=1 Tax=Nonomuraea gerenzanensis TaxID=93944 RepID=A0A1M4EPP9_9ACTN|nr:putative lipoprotein [Nonomuraea gerenzanensis]